MSAGHDRDWMQAANCKGVDPDLFFPIMKEDGKGAKAVCRRCSVEDECLEYAIDTHQDYGIWGGLNEQEIRAEIKYRARQRRSGEQIVRRVVVINRSREL